MDEKILNQKRKEEIQSKIKLAEKKRGKKIHINPPISKQEVRNLEEKYHFKLPRDYFWFITEIGDGGTGPYGELKKFGGHEEVRYQLCGKESRLPKYVPSEDEYAHIRIAEAYIDQYYCEVDENKYTYQEGLISLSYKADHYDPELSIDLEYDKEVVLVGNGDHYGEIVVVDLGEGRLPDPYYGQCFLEWYERWLDDEILGCFSQENFERQIGGSVDELVKQYGETKETVLKDKIWYEFRKFKCLTNGEINKIHALFEYEEDNKLKMEGLHLLQIQKYPRLSEVFLSLMKEENADLFYDLSRIMSYQYVTREMDRAYRYHPIEGIEKWYKHALWMFKFIVEQAESWYTGYRGDTLYLFYCLKLITVNPLFKVSDLEPFFMSTNKYIVQKISEACRKYVNAPELADLYKRHIKNLMEQADYEKLGSILYDLEQLAYEYPNTEDKLRQSLLEGSKFIIEAVDRGVKITDLYIDNVRNRLARLLK